MKARCTLFEKLIDEDTEVAFEKNPKRFWSFTELQNSIMEDLSCLLNTRVAIFWKNYITKNPAIKSNSIPYSYGINVKEVLFSENIFEMQELEARIEDTIKRFEPRLKNPKAHILQTKIDTGSIFINIDATVNIENYRTDVSFPVVIDVKSG